MDITVSRIRSHDKGALKCHFTVEIDGFWIRDCSYFNTGSNEWMNFSQELKPALEGETKPKYVPYCGYTDTTKGGQVKAAIIAALKKELKGEGKTTQKQESYIQADTSELPF